jgi:hypothetical protein
LSNVPIPGLGSHQAFSADLGKSFCRNLVKAGSDSGG